MDSVVKEESGFEKQSKNMSLSEKNRVLAILNCYGVEAYKNNTSIVIEETGEKIIPWHLDGVISKSDLQAIFVLEIIIELYESNKS